MSARVMRITAKSVAELEAMQERAIELARAEGVTVVCHQHLKLPANSKCICGSGRKWKKCCMWEDRTQVTFYPPGHSFKRPRTPRISAALALLGIGAWINPAQSDR